MLTEALCTAHGFSAYGKIVAKGKDDGLLVLLPRIIPDSTWGVPSRHFSSWTLTRHVLSHASS